MNWHKRIVVAPEVSAGKPVIKGTRLSAEFVLELLAGGWSEAQILVEYPGVIAEDVRACLLYACSRLQEQRRESHG